MNTFPQFGALLNQQLAKMDRSPAWLARALQVTDSTVSRWLNDGARPGNPEVVVRIADLLGMSGEREKLLVAAGYGYQEANSERTRRVEEQSTSLHSSLSSVEAVIDNTKRQRLRSNLPQPFTHFVGREAEVEQLTRQLLNPMCRLLTLIGPGGIGKTRLAIEVAREIHAASANFADGVYFISMAEHDSPEQLSVAMATALELAIDGGAEIHSQLLGYLQGKQMLFVLDNFEHRLDATGRVAQLLSAASQVQVLVTSRERLHLPGEHIFQVWGLDYDPAAGGTGEAHTSAAQLFVQSARYAVSHFELTHEEIVHVNEICRQVEGLPLGIELAASWIELLSPAEIADEIQRSIDILARGLPSGHGEHHSMRAVFDSTWRRLGTTEQQVFARLACFQASFTREAAEKVAGASLPLLSALVSKSLIAYRREQRRYSLHALLHQFAREKLLTNAQMAEESYDRLCSYYSDFLSNQALRLKGREHSTAMGEIEAEIENIRSAWQWACAHRQFEYIDRSLEALNIFYMTKDWYQEGLATFEAAANALYMDKPAGEQGVVLAKVLMLQGWMLAMTEFFIEGKNMKDAARVLLQQSLDIFDMLGKHTQSGLVYHALGELAAQAGDNVNAIQLSQEALDIFTELHDPWYMGFVMRNMSHFCYSMGDYQQAFAFARQAIAISEEFGDMTSLAKSFFHLGDALRASGNYEEAKIAGERCLEASSAVGDKGLTAAAVQLLGEVAWHTGNYGAAREYADVALAYNQELGLTRVVDAPRFLQGNIAYSQGDYARARSFFYLILESHLRANTLDKHWGAAEALLGMANVLLKEDKIQLATEALMHVLHHPIAWQETRERAAIRLAELGQEASTERLLTARPIRDVVEELLSDPIATTT